METPSTPFYDAVVVGGGLAGCSLAIHLARAGARVLLAEKQRYPAHKLCGEFLSPEAGGLLGALGVWEDVQASGARAIRHALLTAPSGQQATTALPRPATGFSRYRLDALLFQRARAVGATARDGCAVTAIARGADGVFTVEAGGEKVRARLVLGAWGKRAALDARLERPFLQKRSPLVGFKAHFSGLDLGDAIEMHATPGGYCGLSHVEDGLVNVCWLTHEGAIKKAGGLDALVAQSGRHNALLGARLAAMRRVSRRYETTAQVTFRPKGLFADGVCMVGDTAAMITPFCGDGMAMALESAARAAPLALAFLDGTLSEMDFARRYRQVWRRAFAPRLLLGRALHALFTRPALADALVRGMRLAPPAAAWAVRQTRGALHALPG